jgi:hypothetical protein
VEEITAESREELAAEPIGIRKLDRIETTGFASINTPN